MRAILSVELKLVHSVDGTIWR